MKSASLHIDSLNAGSAADKPSFGAPWAIAHCVKKVAPANFLGFVEMVTLEAEQFALR